MPHGTLTPAFKVTGFNGNTATIPTGQQVTPTLAEGSSYQRLATGLRPDGNADADSAMTSALSPDGTTLLVLTSGFNVTDNFQVTQTADNPVPLLFPVLNPLTGANSPFVNPNGSFTVFSCPAALLPDGRCPQGAGVAQTTAPGTQVNQSEFVFVYDVRKKTPVKTQQIYIPDTFDGLSWAPDGSRFYVSGGVDDRILVYRRQNAAPASHATAVSRTVVTTSVARPGRSTMRLTAMGLPTPIYVPDAPFIGLKHNPLGTATIPVYSGGMLSTTPLGQAAQAPNSPLAFAEALFTGGVAAGVSVSNDGNTMLVANFENASASFVNLQTRTVTSEIVFTPPGKIQPSDAKGEFPFWTAVKSDNLSGAFVKGYVSSYRDDDVMVVTPGSNAAKEIKTCAGPNKMLMRRDNQVLYVACGNDDSIAVIDTNTDTVTRTISLARPGPKGRYKGSNPDSLALTSDGRTLYVTLGGENALAVVDTGSGTVRGRIPTGWLPTSVSLSADGKTLYVVNEKSNEGPNPGQIYYVPAGTPPGSNVVNPNNPTNANLYTWAAEKSGLLTIPVPQQQDLPYYSAIVDANDGFNNPSRPDWIMQTLQRKIKHVIYIVNENRTYDQVLGDLHNGSNGDPALAFYGQDVTPNLHALAEDYVTLDNYYSSSETSGVGWNWSMQSHTNDFIEKTQPVQYGNSNGYGLTYDWQSIVMNMNLQQPVVCGPGSTVYNCRITTLLTGNTNSTILPGPKDPSSTEGAQNLNPSVLGGYIWESALRAGKTVRDYGWQIDLTYYSAPANSPLYPQKTRTPYASNILQSSPGSPTLAPYTDEYYRAFDQSYPDIGRVEEWQREFAGYVKNNNLPSLEVMTIPHDHTGSFGASQAYSGLGTPQLELSDHDWAIGKLVEAVSHSKYWASTAIIIIEGDPQNGQDHVEAHRSIAHVISPYTKSHYVDHTFYTYPNVLRTIEDLLGINHLSMYDDNAVAMSTVFSTAPNLQPYTPIIPGSLCTILPGSYPFGTLVPECFGPDAASYKRSRAVPQLHDYKWWDRHTIGMDFSRPDRVPAQAYNQLQEYGITGRGAPPKESAILAHVQPDADGD